MSNSYVGQIILFAGTFTIRNFAMCNGQILPISQNTALFSILGTTYGGNGTTNFALPDLRSRVPIHFGQGNGLSSYVLGETDGLESVALLQSQMPAHNHFINAQSGLGTAASPSGGFLAVTARSNVPYDTYVGSVTSAAQLNPSAVSVVGSSQAHENRQPLLALNYQICLFGIYPSRS